MLLVYKIAPMPHLKLGTISTNTANSIPVLQGPLVGREPRPSCEGREPTPGPPLRGPTPGSGICW